VKKISLEGNQVELLLSKDDKITADYIIAAIGRTTKPFAINKNVKKIRGSNRIYLIGDLISGLNRQISIAAGQGLDCAMKIARDAKTI
jgi:thioredoxin reductase